MIRQFKSPIVLLVTGGVLLFGISSGLWWTKVYQEPQRVYWDMLSNSLQMSSVTRSLTENTDKSKLSQTVVLTLGAGVTPQDQNSQNGPNAQDIPYNQSARNMVELHTTLGQGANVIKTENIGTLGKDYIRYTGITSEQKTTDGKKLDFSKVLNKWAATDAPNIANQKNPSLLPQVMLGLAGGNLIPQANLPAKDRDKLIHLLHNTVVFDTKFGSVKKQLVHGRPIYTYPVDVQAVGYVGFEKEFAKVVGLRLLDDIQPNDYQGRAPTKVEVGVDAWSHQLVSVNFVGQPRQETYSAHGAVHKITVPDAKLSGEQLQQLVNKVQ